MAYIQIVMGICQQKAVPKCVRLTIGGDKVNYPREVTADLTTVKLHLKSMVSMPNGKFLCIDINNFYLESPLDWPEYALIARKYVPQQLIDEVLHLSSLMAICT